MSELVWIHKFNKNELGLGNRGAFCLVPVEARKIFFPNIDFSESPNIDEQVTLVLKQTGEQFELTYKKPESKSEHRLSLSKGISKHVGNQGSNTLIQPEKIGCFYRKDQNIYLSIADSDSAYGGLLNDFPSRGNNNNLVTSTVFQSKNTRLRLQNYLLLPKPFILLAGISGTGKTRFVREQAKATSQGNKNYEIVPVRPDWHEPSDLLGYISRLGEHPEYVPTKVLSFIAQAWAHLNPHTVEVDESGRAWWSIQSEDKVPYWLCLDEMNLAPVEQYFADYLSVLETREFDYSAETLKYRSDALVSADLINGLNAEAARNLQAALGVSDSLFEHFKAHGIPLPFNLIIAGTVNMDETTHGFSRKVIDRAFTIDYGLFFENKFEEFFDGQPSIQPLTFSTVTDAREPGLFSENESFRDKSVSFLTEVNSVLKGTPFELAFRALNELLLSVHCFNPTSERELAAVWDDFLMTKVLPRIEGDSDKLSLPDAGSTGDNNNVLSTLETALEKIPAFNQILTSERIDFFRTDSNGDALNVDCRSIDAVKRMQTRLETNGYTSFWP